VSFELKNRRGSFPRHGSQFCHFSTPWKQVSEKVPHHGSPFRRFSTAWKQVFHGMEAGWAAGKGRRGAGTRGGRKEEESRYDLPCKGKTFFSGNGFFLGKGLFSRENRA